MTKNRILQICLSPSWGGLEMVAYETAQLLESKNVECWNLVCEKSPLANKLHKAQLKVIEIRPGRSRILKNVLIARKFIKKKNIASIWVQHLHDLYIPALALLKKKGLPVVGFSHTFVNIHKTDPYHFFVYKKLNTLIALTESHKENLITHLPIHKDCIQIIPNSVDIQQFHPSKRSDFVRNSLDSSGTMILIGLIGRIDKAKGQQLLLEAADRLKLRGLQNFKLAFVGEETLNEPGILRSLKEKAHTFGLEQNTIFMGYRSDIPEVMASLDIVVMASDAETFGRVIIEAMASGTAVVASRAGGVVDIIDDKINGLLFTTKDSTSLADALEKLIQNPEIRSELAQKALVKVHEKFNKEIVQKQILNLLPS